VFDAMLDFPEFAVGMVRGLAIRNDELIQRLLGLEGLLGRFHAQLRAAGIEPADDLLHETQGLVPQRGGRVLAAEARLRGVELDPRDGSSNELS
jgi:hypothetical protein